MAAAQRLDPADDAGAAAEGDDGDALGGADLERAPDRAGVRRQEHRVGRRVEPPAAQSRQVRVAAAGRVPQPVLGFRRRRWPRRPRRPAPAAAARLRAARSAPARRRAATARARRFARAASPAPARRAAARPSGRPSPTTSSRGAGSRQRPLQPVQRRVEDLALAAAQHRRAEARHPAQPLLGGEADLGAAVGGAAGRSRPTSCADGARTGCPRAAAPRRSARPRPS